MVSSLSKHHTSSTGAHHLLHFRGGDVIENTHDKETATTISIQDDNDEVGKDLSDDAWAEEIKRLQMYLNSPQSRHGAGEDILVLGSKASTKNNSGGKSSKVLADPRSDDNQSSAEELEYQSTQDGAPIPDQNIDDQQKDISSISNENDVNEQDKTVADAPCNESNDEINPDNNDTEVNGQVSETATHHENVDLDMPHAEPQDDDIILDTSMDDAILKEDSIEQDTNPGIAEPPETQIITDHYSEALLIEDSDLEEENDTTFPEDQSIVTNRWQAAPTLAESNKLVEEGLSKLRRKDGDHPSVPYVITRAMKRVLVDELGYEEEEVKIMRPDVAVVIVSENLKRPSIAILPSRFYHEDMIESVQHIESMKETFQSKIQTFVQKIDLKQSIFMIGSALASYSVVSIFTNANSEQKHDLETICESPDSDEVNENQLPDAMIETQENEDIKKSDLDRTWLDRLISMLTFYK